jgi:2-phosphosulfolactate phosphatase
MDKTVIIDAFPESAKKYHQDHAIVVVDVIRATTTATTAVSMKREVFPIQTTDEAFILADKMENAILVGELGGNVPYGFHMTNSPVLVKAMGAMNIGNFSDSRRPIILLSSSGTQLLMNAKGAKGVFTASLRNMSAICYYVGQRYSNIAVIGAGTRGKFRREDQMCCAWIAEKLGQQGFNPANEATQSYIEKWKNQKVDVIRDGDSAEYLRRSGQSYDLEYIINCIDDLTTVPCLQENKLVDIR